MRGLLQLLAKYHVTLLFIFIEVVALGLLSSKNSFHSAKVYNLNYGLSSRIAERYAQRSRFRKLHEKNESLVKENARLYNSLDQSFLASDTFQMDTTLIRHYEYIPARIINNSVNKQYNFITLNRGSRDGIEPDMGVICKDGVVGIVKAVSKNFASVVPVLNRDWFIPAQIKSNGFRGIVGWPGKNYRKVVLTEIPQHANIVTGDSVVTSGKSSIFPQGIMIGKITDFSLKQGVRYEIEVKLSMDFKKLNHVMIIRNMLRDEQLELEEANIND